eukprot:775368-Rhodomonas_salina.2
MSDAQELAELFLGYPDTSATQGTLQGYEQIYHKDFYATAPSVSHIIQDRSHYLSCVCLARSPSPTWAKVCS